ncbi:MAG: lysylphosphatidylglycerol synthase transmembrane domain-containing protein [bacterium]
MAALGVYGLSAVGGAFQWAWILRVAGIKAPNRELHRLYLVGLFFNNFLPANVGGDAVKIFDLGRQEGQPLKVFCATLLDRLLGLTSLTLLALLAVATAVIRTTTLPPAYPLFVAMVVWLGLLVLLLSRRISSVVLPILHRIRLGKVADKIEAVLEEFRLYRARVSWFGSIFLFAMLVQSLRVLTHILVAIGLSITLTGEQGLQLFVLVPLLGILIALPISVNGIGLREYASAEFFVFAGISAQHAVAMELTAYLVQVVFSLVGGYLFWRGHRILARSD